MSKKNKEAETLLEEIRRKSGLDGLEQGLFEALERIKKRAEKEKEKEGVQSDD